MDAEALQTLATPTAGAPEPTSQAAGAPEPTSAPPPARATTQRRRTSRASQAAGTIYDKLVSTIAYLAILLIACIMWYIGAYYTLAAVRELFSVDTSHLAWFSLPAAITAIELKLINKLGSSLYDTAVFTLVLLVDIGTSWRGLIANKGKTLPLFNGIMIPDSGIALNIFGLALGTAFAFLPEKIARYAIQELKAIWS